MDSFGKECGWLKTRFQLLLMIGLIGLVLLFAGITLVIDGFNKLQNEKLSSTPSVDGNLPNTSTKVPAGTITTAPTCVKVFDPINSPTMMSLASSLEPSHQTSTVLAPSPTTSPKMRPTQNPTRKLLKPSPTNDPSQLPTTALTNTITEAPTPAPVTTARPSSDPTDEPTHKPAQGPDTLPSRPDPTNPEVTYRPGDLTTLREGLLLSQGLDVRVVTRTGKPVQYNAGHGNTTSSPLLFHGQPDFGATFPDSRPGNEGGWIYTSNSEMPEPGQGGVGAITFNKDGHVVDYRMVLTGTTMNCGGGRTPWNTWVSCEEVEFMGLIYQVDPTGSREAQLMTLGSSGGRWESFAYDIRDKENPRFFATEDHNKGTVRRFTPDIVNWDDPWNLLHGEGVIDY